VLFTKYYWGDQIKEGEIGRACSTHGQMRNAFKILVGKPDGRRPLGRSRYGWEDNVKWILGK
jgi:hypothetical protein